MEKLLHERLRDWAGEPYPTESARGHYAENDGRVNPMSRVFAKMSDEIERYYIPRPRFEDGEPVPGNHEDERVGYYYVFDDGSWVLRPVHDGSDCDEINGHADEPVKLPTSKALDADGVPCERGDRVYPIRRKAYSDADGYIVDHVEVDDGINSPRVYFIDDAGMSWMKACELTHHEPDSLEKLRDDIETCNGDYVEWGSRLTALIERGA